MCYYVPVDKTASGILTIAFLVLFSAFVYKNFFKLNYEIISVKTYSSPDTKFSFSYPEFKGWEVTDQMVLEADNIHSSVYFKDSKQKYYPQGTYFDIESPRMEISYGLTSSPPPANYKEYDRSNGKVYVATPDNMLIIIKIPSMEEGGFSSKAMANMILSTIKFNLVKATTTPKVTEYGGRTSVVK